MFIDQYGETYYCRTRKELTVILECKHVEKIYADRNGKTYHVGYLIAGKWLRKYTEVEREVK